MLSRKTRDQFITLVEQSVQPLGLFCREIEWVPHESILRVYVEGSSAPTMDMCVQASRVIGELTAFDDAITASYQLEVSSPGLEPPLRTPAHFKDAIGRWVKAEIRNALGKIEMVQGTLEEANDASITLKNQKDAYEVAFNTIEFAKVLFKPDYSPKTKKPFVKKGKEAQ